MAHATPPQQPQSPPVAILTGPTATGKTALALDLASQLRSIEIINADSMLVYRGMDIGTAKPTPDELKQVPHHLIDIQDPDQPYTAGDFVRETERALADIHSRRKRALIVGGTGFYLKALLYGLWDSPPADPAIRTELEALDNTALWKKLLPKDPASAERIGPNDRYRLIRALEIIRITGKTPTQLQAGQPSEPDPRFRLWIIDRDNAELYARIHLRTRLMLEQGFVDEVKRILARYPEARSLSAVGYQQVVDHLAGKLPPGRKISPGTPGLAEEIELATRQLVKRQRTWFRGQPQAQWFKLDQDRARLESALKALYTES